MLKHQYKIKVREKTDYDRLINDHIPTSSLRLKTIFFHNSTDAKLEDDIIVINSKLNISIVTIILGVLLTTVSYVLYQSFENLYTFFIYLVIVFVAIYYIILLEHDSIECQILRKLY